MVDSRIAFEDISLVQCHAGWRGVDLHAARGVGGVEVEEEHRRLAIVDNARCPHRACNLIGFSSPYPHSRILTGQDGDFFTIDEARTSRFVARAVEAGNVLAIGSREETESIVVVVGQTRSEQSLPVAAMVLFHMAIQNDFRIGLVDVASVERLFADRFDVREFHYRVGRNSLFLLEFHLNEDIACRHLEIEVFCISS